MHKRLLQILRCPSCRAAFETRGVDDDSVDEGELVCEGCGSRAPIRGGIARLLELTARGQSTVDEQTRQSFSFEWAFHRPEDGTWGMTLENRTSSYFLKGVGLTPEEVPGLHVLDAGCGNGSSTLGMARLGALAVGIDQSNGVEASKAYLQPSDSALSLDYVQGNLMDAPFAPASFDVVFSAGVLHHTPDTRRAFLALAPLVKPGGRFYVWLYRREPRVTAVVDAIRTVTTRVPPTAFVGVAVAMSPAFQLFTWAANATGLREYPSMSWRASALALFDIFGARYAHAHHYDEVAGWYEEAGFEKPRLCTMERRGFSVCGRRPAKVAS
jgi:SAM-dependent methyltransferase